MLYEMAMLLCPALGLSFDTISWDVRSFCSLILPISVPICQTSCLLLKDCVCFRDFNLKYHSPLWLDLLGWHLNWHLNWQLKWFERKIWSWPCTGLHQEGAYTYSGIPCPECVHQFFCCLLRHIMHFVNRLQLDLNADTKVYAFKFI